MNMILCSEPCMHQHDGCCALDGAGVITNSLLSPCRYFTPLDMTEFENTIVKGDKKHEPYKNR